MSEIIPIISGILLALGSFLMFTGALGVLRFPDLFSRMHAAGITETLATSLLLSLIHI